MTTINTGQSSYYAAQARLDRPSIQPVTEYPSYKEFYQNLTPEQQRNLTVGVEEGVQSKKDQYHQTVETLWRADIARAEYRSDKALMESHLSSINGSTDEQNNESTSSLTFNYLDYQAKKLETVKTFGSYKRNINQLAHFQSIVDEAKAKSEQMQAYQQAYYQKGEIIHVSA